MCYNHSDYYKKGAIEVSKEENTVKFRVVKIVFRIILAVLTVLLGTLAMLAYKGIFWMFKTWNHLTMDELVFHLNSPWREQMRVCLKTFFIPAELLRLLWQLY